MINGRLLIMNKYLAILVLIVLPFTAAAQREYKGLPDDLDKNKINQYLSNGDYPGLFYYYETYGFKLMQHELMAAHYVEIMSKILSDFDNNTYEYSYYQSLVWIGSLQKTVTYTKKDSTEKRDIDDAYFIEMTNGYRLCIEN